LRASASVAKKLTHVNTHTHTHTQPPTTNHAQKVGTSHTHRYPRWKAALLPLSVPLLIVAVMRDDPLALLLSHGAAYAGLCCFVGCALVWGLYPAGGEHVRAPVKGVFAALTFALSVLWLHVTATSLVAICALLGRVFGISPALLGATALAWGNSGNDLVSDTAMARDGFPTMAVTACFASPLFALLMGGLFLPWCVHALRAWCGGRTRATRRCPFRPKQQRPTTKTTPPPSPSKNKQNRPVQA
jgi:Ca2+/Na+ antiporter